MFTKWYKNILRGRREYTVISGMKAFDETAFTYYGNNRASRSVYEIALGYALNQAPMLPTNFVGSGWPCVSFGSGTTAPTEEDYKLESWLENVTYAKGTLEKTYGTDQDKIANTFMITNTGTEAVTVSEVGIFAPAAAASSGTTTYYTMLERSVFEPVTIAPGESATVKYEIVINYPVA